MPRIRAKAVLAAALATERRGSPRVLRHLEQDEPELAEYVMEKLSLIYRQLLATRLPDRTTRRLFRAVEELTLTCAVAALSAANARDGRRRVKSRR